MTATKYPKYYAVYKFMYDDSKANSLEEERMLFIIDVLVHKDSQFYLCRNNPKDLNDHLSKSELRSVIRDAKAIEKWRRRGEGFAYSCYHYKYWTNECGPEFQYLPSIKEIQCAIDFVENEFSKNTHRMITDKFAELYSSKTAREIRAELIKTYF